MKKITSILLVAIMIIALLSACADAGVREYSPSPAPSAAAAPAAREYKDAYAKYPADEKVLTINGKSVLWDEFFYWLHNSLSRLESYVGAVKLSATSPVDANITNEEFVNNNIKEILLAYHVLEEKLAENKVKLTDEDTKKLDEIRAEDIKNFCGDGKKEEDLYTELEKMFVTPRVYEYVNRTALLHAKGQEELFGKNGEKVSDSDIEAFVKEKDYMHAKHILLSFKDKENKPISDEQKAEKLKLAKEILAELSAIKDKDELIKRFDALMQEKSEDPGKEHFKEGYTFTPGTMVPEFEKAIKELKDGEITAEPVESVHGYHIILRLPVGGDDQIMQGQSVSTLRSAVARDAYDKLIKSWTESAEVKWESAFENLKIAELFGESADK